MKHFLSYVLLAPIVVLLLLIVFGIPFLAFTDYEMTEYIAVRVMSLCPVAFFGFVAAMIIEEDY